MNALALLLAFAVDKVFGEPATRWHPVGWMGHYLGWIGGRIGPHGAQSSGHRLQFWSGALAWWGGALGVLLVALLLQQAADAAGPVVGTLLIGLVLKTMLSWRMLREEVAQVEEALGRSLDAGRLQLGRLVSRDVMRLDATQVRESAIESLAENLNDSVVAPIFWFVVAGLPGAAIYRFANTADAMWGYRGTRAGIDWTWAGKWAARADDVLSWVPARLTALLLGLAAGGLSLRALAREARRTPSPNSGWPMGAMALALAVRLGKPGVYTLNEGGAAPRREHTVRALRLATWATGLLVVWACAMLALMAGAHAWT